MCSLYVPSFCVINEAPKELYIALIDQLRLVYTKDNLGLIKLAKTVGVEGGAGAGSRELSRTKARIVAWEGAGLSSPSSAWGRGQGREKEEKLS